MIVRTERRLVHAGYHRRTARRADRAGNESAIKLHTLFGQPIEVRCFNEFLAVATYMWGGIFYDNPNNIRTS